MKTTSLGFLAVVKIPPRPHAGIVAQRRSESPMHICFSRDGFRRADGVVSVHLAFWLSNSTGGFTETPGFRVDGESEMRGLIADRLDGKAPSRSALTERPTEVGGGLPHGGRNACPDISEHRAAIGQFRPFDGYGKIHDNRGITRAGTKSNRLAKTSLCQIFGVLYFGAGSQLAIFRLIRLAPRVCPAPPT
jgi:hypothetical protein